MIAARRLLPLLFAVVPAIAAHAAPGDVNGDGSVTLEDAALASRLASGVQTPSLEALQTADVASVAGAVRDAWVDWRDVDAILRVAGGFAHFVDASAPGDGLDAPGYILDLTGDRTLDFKFRVIKNPPPPPTGITVSGHVTGVAEGTQSPRVWFVQFEPGGSRGSGTSVRSDGTYERGLSAGDYALYFGGTATEAVEGGTYAWGFAAPVGREVNVSAPMTVDLTAPPTPPAGLLTGSLDLGNLVATSVAGLRSPMSTSESWLPGFLQAAGVAGPSSYSLKVTPGAYDLTLSASYPPDPAVKFLLGMRSGDVAAGETQTRDVSLPDAVPVTFDMAPPPGGIVEQISMSGHLGNPQTSVSATTDFTEEATSYTTVAPPGDYSVTAHIALAGPPEDEVTLTVRAGSKTVPPGGGTVVLALPQPQMLTFQGHVTYPNSTPAAGARVALTPYDQGQGYLAYASTVTGEDGAFSMTVPAGRYQTRVTAFAVR